jgi:galactose mutarotase-like enzyme
MEKNTNNRAFLSDNSVIETNTLLVKPLIKKYHHQSLECISIENEVIQAAFLPKLGGKMIALTDKDKQYQFLLEPQNVSKKYEKSSYGSDFSLFDVSGFDECFPTVERSDEFPDHGELWSRPWNYTIDDGNILLSVTGIKADYEFRKKVSLKGNSVELLYSVTNNMNKPFQYLWSAHPLLKINSGVRVVMPEQVTEVFLNWSSDQTIGAYGDIIPWPSVPYGVKRSIDLSTMIENETGISVKCFSNLLQEGFVGLYNPFVDRTLLFEFDPKEIPYVGLWLCHGGWPVESSKKHFAIALEPCSGRPDKLSNAVQRNEHQTINPGETKTWSMSIGVWPGLKKSSSNYSSLHFHSA